MANTERNLKIVIFFAALNTERTNRYAHSFLIFLLRDKYKAIRSYYTQSMVFTKSILSVEVFKESDKYKSLKYKIPSAPKNSINVL